MFTKLIAAALLILSYNCKGDVPRQDNLTGYDYRLFENTPEWPLAKAVRDQDTSNIFDLVRHNRAWLYAREPDAGETLLQIAVKTLKYNSVQALVALGANPNAQDNYDGSSPLMEAARIILNDDGTYGSNPKYLKLLLAHGGDPNLAQKAERPKGGDGIRETPLLIACSRGNFEYVKMLIEAGADVHYKMYNVTTIYDAAIAGSPDIVLYLIGKGVAYKKPFMQNIKGEDVYLTDLMQDWNIDAGSDKYKSKLKLIDLLKQNGMNYTDAKK